MSSGSVGCAFAPAFTQICGVASANDRKCFVVSLLIALS